ncbi:Hypothetical predicted protein [Mytilus galloprovincialis]|uniref:ANK_REP_REGION domain-containing protein n=1 Tax=Mytilus galloprovincialis TaxID=29158 RepID=A0A8B6BTZ0_MYTGA|nr:Hypothetical predicted protein [Mytilus galloprovincialis]
MCEANYAFPLLCKLVSNNDERFRERIIFFRQPLSLLKEELDKISNDNKKLYCILILCLLFDGLLSRSMFDIDSTESDKKIYKIIKTCGLQSNISKKALEESAYSALGSYFTKDSYNFRFIHDALEETVGCHFCTLNPEEMFSDCNILFIRDRVRVQLNTNADENIVVLREDELNEDRLRPLYHRLLTELKSGRFSNLLMSQLFKNRNFVNIFGTHLKTSQRIFDEPFSEASSEWQRSIFQSIFQKQSKDEFKDNKDAINRVMEAKRKRSTIMHWIVAFGCYEFFRYAWSVMTPSKRKQILGRDYKSKPLSKSFFPLAVLGGSLNIVKELIDSGADVNCFSEFFETPLYIAVKSGSCDMVHLLLKKGAHINLRLWFDMKVPILVISNNNQLS